MTSTQDKGFNWRGTITDDLDAGWILNHREDYPPAAIEVAEKFMAEWPERIKRQRLFNLRASYLREDGYCAVYATRFGELFIGSSGWACENPGTDKEYAWDVFKAHHGSASDGSAVSPSPRLTYRERRERKAERLREWAEKREAKSEAAFAASDAAVAGRPFGEPIHIGHHSQRRDERNIERSRDRLSQGVEHSRKAERFNEKADNIEAAAERAIYSDDEDAVEKLRERVATLEAERATIKADNAEFRKAHKGEFKGMTAYQKDQALPHAGYKLTNLSGNINRNKKRLAKLEAVQQIPDSVENLRQYCERWDELPEYGGEDGSDGD